MILAQFLLSGVLQEYFRMNYYISYREDHCVMCCPSTKVIKSDSKKNLAIGGLHEDKLCDTLQEMVPTSVKTVHQTSLLHNIESNFDQLGLFFCFFKKNQNAPRPSVSPTASVLSNKADKSRSNQF